MDSKTQPFPVVHKGVVQKLEPGLLQEGQFENLSNMTSIQEGALTVRLGSKKFLPSGAEPNLGTMHSSAKLGLGGDDSADLRYIGTGGAITRVTGPYSSYTEVTSGMDLADQARWEAAVHNSGGSGKPSIYFGHQDRMLRDNGAFTPLRPWGITRPTRPPVLGLADPRSTNYPGLVVLATNVIGGVARVTTSVSSATVVNGNYYRIVPASMANLLPGEYVELTLGGSPGFVLVDNVDSASFYAYCPAAPSGAITSFYTPVAGTVADGGSYAYDFAPLGSPVDLSFQGDPFNGYDSDDNIHIGFFVENLTYLKEIRLRIFPNGQTTDYYEKAITPPQSQQFTSGTATSVTTVEGLTQQVTQGVQGDVTFPDDTFQGLQPVQIPPTATATWFEYDVPKNQFLKVGNAGNSYNSWKSITGIEVLVITNQVSGSPAFAVRVGASYAQGNQGPDSLSSPTAKPYAYVYTYRDPSTGAEGNPCSTLIANSRSKVFKRAVQVTCFGASTDPLVGNPAIDGFGSIAVYRAGGTFADDFYRFVGYSTNPGPGGQTVFADNQPDFQIATNRLALFDNDEPVTSDLPIPFAGVIGSLVSPFGFTNVFVINYQGYGASDPAMSTFFSKGSLVTIGNGTNQEVCVVEAIGTTVGLSGNFINVFLQNSHFAGEQVTCSAKASTPCDIVCRAGDSILLAGDSQNPHKVYRSKSGFPHAFPTINNETGNSHVINCGSPSNPILGLTEFNGQYISLNKSSLFQFQLWQGDMSEPQQTPANRGMISKHCYCKADNELWYLSYDGIYSWSGAQSTKRSEAINWVFNKTDVGALVQMDYDQTQYCHLYYFESMIWFIYRDKQNNTLCLRYSTIYDRWEPFTANSTQGGLAGVLTAALVEDDTGRFIGGVFDNGAGGHMRLFQFESGYSEGYIGSLTSGSSIDFLAKTWSYSPEGRNTNKLFSEIGIELDNPGSDVTVRVYYDFSPFFDATDVFVIAASTAGRRIFPLPLQQGAGTTNGKEARVIAFEFFGTSKQPFAVYSISFTYAPIAEVQRGRITDWTDNGWQHDKHYILLEMEYQLNGAPINLFMDVLTGNTWGDNPVLAREVFSLHGNGRTKASFPIHDQTIAKMARLRPSVAPSIGNYEIISWKFVVENYPPDVVYTTEYKDYGQPLDKFVQRLLLDINTDGIAVPFYVYADGLIQQTLSVNSTLENRNQRITLNPSILARKVKIVPVVPLPAGARFQLFGWEYEHLPADKGPLIATQDWDNLGWQFDKKLRSLTITAEGFATGQQITFDTLTGISGNIVILNDPQLTFTLAGTGRVQSTFPVPDGKVVKALRCHPVKPGGDVAADFRIWGFTADKEDYPQDIVLFTEWDDQGYAHLKYAQEIALDVDTGGVAALVQFESDSGQTQTLTVTSTNSTRDQIFTLSPQIAGKKFRLRTITPGANGKFQMWSLKVKYLKADMGEAEHTFDFDDLGHPYDKHLVSLTIDYDTAGAAVTLNVDTVTGINGSQTNIAALSFTLQTSGRCKTTFPIAEGVVVKLVRVYPASNTTAYRQWGYSFAKENYPQDTVYFTEYESFGTPHLKIIQEVAFDVNTNNVPATVRIVSDGGDLQTVTIDSTLNTRDQIVTLSPQLYGKKFKLLITPGIGGCWQMWSWKPHFTPGDLGPVVFSQDYDSLGTLYSKRPATITVDYDLVGGGPVSMIADYILGDGITIQLAAWTFQLTGTGRSKQTFAFPDGTIFVSIRIHPASTQVTFKAWSYSVVKEDLPANLIINTEWQDLGYPCPKQIRYLEINADTGGVPCSLALQADGVTIWTFSITTTDTDRYRIVTPPPELSGRLFRIVPTPGTGGRYQKYSENFDTLREPCPGTTWSSEEISLGGVGFHYLKRLWLMYKSAAQVRVSIYRDGFQLFYQKDLPAHAHRDVETFLLPVKNSTALNKSKLYYLRVEAIDGTTQFQFWIDGSRLEYLNLSTSQREAFRQFELNEKVQTQV